MFQKGWRGFGEALGQFRRDCWDVCAKFGGGRWTPESDQTPTVDSKEQGNAPCWLTVLSICSQVV